MRRTLAVVALVLLTQPALAFPALAFDDASHQWGVSTEPYWKVGRPSDELSSLCRAGHFNEKRVGLLYISFIGKEGRGIVGVAKADYNLYDPLGKADPQASYHFYADGTSDCAVFVSP